MRKKLLSLVLAVCMVLSLPAEAGSMTHYTIGETPIGYATDLSNNDVITNANGVGWTWAYDSQNSKGTLTLSSAYLKGMVNNNGNSYGAYLPGGTTIVLNGDSTVAAGATENYNTSSGIYCDGALTIKNGETGGAVGSLTAVGGTSGTSGTSGAGGNDSIGLQAKKVLTVSSGKVTGIGGTAYNSSYGIYALGGLDVSGIADVTGIAGTANAKMSGTLSCGVYMAGYGAAVSGGSLTAVGGYAGGSNGAKSYGILAGNGVVTVSGGGVTAQGGKSASGDSYGIRGSTTVSNTAQLVASSGECGNDCVSHALYEAPTDGTNPLTALTGAQTSKFAVYGSGTTYPTANILSGTLDLSTWSDGAAHWDDSTGGYKTDTVGDVKTLTLKNMIICGADASGLAFGIYGQGNISIVYEGVNIVCGGASANSDSCGIEVEATGENGLTFSDGGTLVALGRQASKSSNGIELVNPDSGDTGNLNVNSGKVITLCGNSGDSSSGLSAYKNLSITGGDITAAGGASANSVGISGGTGISVSSGQLVAVGGYASGADSVSAGALSAGTTIFSGAANAVAVGDGYGIATYSVGVDEETGDSIMTPADFQLGASAADTATLTVMGGTSASNGKATTTVSDKVILCDGGTCATAGSAVRFRVGDPPVIAVAHDGSNFTNYASFADGWNETVGTNNKSTTEVQFLADWTAEHDDDHSSSFGRGAGFYDGTAPSAEGAVCVPVDKHIILDLNGFTMDRILDDPCINSYGGWVIANLGTLTIQDSGTDGTIKGGYISADDGKYGGGIYNASTLTLENGTITKNADGTRGGGVYNTGNFTMTGGKISANFAATGVGASGCGGGVYNAAEATFTMTGGEISGNYSCDIANDDGGGVYNAGTFNVGGTAKITGDVSKAVYDSETNTASGGVTDNVYLPSGKTVTCAATTPLLSGASIGVTTKTVPGSGTPVAVTGDNSADYSGYFSSDKSCRIQNSGSSLNQVVQLAVMPRSDIFGAKFYQPQLWDCQRSPAFPVAGRSFRLSSLKAPYDQNLRKVNFAALASDYVTFEYVKDVSALDAATQTRIVNSLKRYTGATAEQIKAAAVVKEVLHSGTNQATETERSSVGLVWALEDDSFLYTAMDGALKYSGGGGTYVTFAAHKTGESIIYTPDKTEPYTNGEITANDKKLALEDGVKTALTAVTYQELIRVMDNSSTLVPVSNATVTITVNGSEYSGMTDANGCVQFTGLPAQEVASATVQSGTYKTLTITRLTAPKRF